MMQDTSSEARESTSGRRAFLMLALLLGVVLGSCSRLSNEQGNILAPAGGDLSHGPAQRKNFDQEIAGQCGSLGLKTDQPARLGRAPYLQGVDATRATIVWTSESSALALRVRLPDGSESQSKQPVVDSSASPKKGRQYLAELTGLSAGTLYCYELQEGAATIYSGGFRTAPNAEATVRFSAFGDLGKDSPDQHAVLKFLKTFDSEFLLVMGDVAYDKGTRAQFESYFFGVYADLLSLVPVFPASGNHDYATNDAAAFREVFVLPTHDLEEGRERWYSFDWGPVHVAVLDTQVMLTKQAAWLREDLASSALPWKIVVMHKPPYSSGAHGSDESVRDLLVPVFREAKVHLVLAGHDHNYERTYVTDGVHYVVSGGGGRGTRDVRSSVFTAYAAKVAHFVYLVADPSSLTLHAIDATGQEFDTLKIEQ